MRTPPRSRFNTPLPNRPPTAGGWGVWDRFLQTRGDTGFMQSSWWAEFRAAAGFRNFGVVIRHHGAVIGGGVVQSHEWSPGTGFYYLPEGPVLPDDPARGREVFEALLRSVRHHRHGESAVISHLRIEPRWTELPDYLRDFDTAPAPEDPFTEPRHTLCVDLRGSETGILAQMHPKGRYNIAVARRHGIRIVEDGSAAGVADFLTLYRGMTGRKGLPPKSDAYFTTLIPALHAAGRGALLFAQLGDERLAAALVVYFGVRGTYFFGASSPTHRDAMAPYLLQFEAMRRAKGRGCEAYDLWGIAPPDAPDHPWSGITEFKMKFGGSRLDLVPTTDLVFDRGAYARYLGRPAG